MIPLAFSVQRHFFMRLAQKTGCAEDFFCVFKGILDGIDGLSLAKGEGYAR